jgi:putative transposase
MVKKPFSVVAMVVLPEHLHCEWRLPRRDADFATRWRLIKTWFTKHREGLLGYADANPTFGEGRSEVVGYADANPTYGEGRSEVVGYADANPTYGENLSRVRKGERMVWQRRYWEHVIRDEADLRHHVEYIHYNPVKHGYVARPIDWQFSSFRRFVKSGVYAEDWGAGKVQFPDDVGSE